MWYEQIGHILPWVVPPVIGGCIGFITNAIAIRMLFRPLQAYYIGPLRIPFTPGIIPKQRESLARSIGKMVSKELITGTAVKEHLHSEKFQETLQAQVAKVTSSVLDMKLKDISTGKTNSFYSAATKSLKELYTNFIQSSNFEKLVYSLVSTLVPRLLYLQAGKFLDSETVRSAVCNRVIPAISSQDMREWVKKKVIIWYEDRTGRNIPLDDILPDPLLDLVLEAVESLYPFIFEALMEWLRTPDTKSELIVQGKSLLRSILSRLNFFQKFLVSAGQYDRTLEENMPAIVEDALGAFKKAGSSKRSEKGIALSAKKGLQKWRQEGFAEFTQERSEKVKNDIILLIDTVFAMLENPKIQEKTVEYIEKLAQGLEGSSLLDISENYFGADKETIIDYVYERIVSLLRNPDMGEKLSGFSGILDEYLHQNRELRVGEVLTIPKSTKNDVDVLFSNTIINIIDLRIEDVITSLDIQALVENRVNSLDIKDVERLLLIVIKKHLKYINIFGGILGGLIGFLQSIYMVFY
ncbi:MAG: DUF445 domain-containing protein [Spirochaetia bacterium]